MPLAVPSFPSRSATPTSRPVTVVRRRLQRLQILRRGVVEVFVEHEIASAHDQQAAHRRPPVAAQVARERRHRRRVHLHLGR
jgi:hypothetical protein